MARTIQGSTHDLQDVTAFIDKLQRLGEHPLREARELFETDSDLYVARAPGRLDVMGGIADYSGSLTLELPIKEAALVALQKDETRTLRIVSFNAEENNRTAAFEMPLAAFEEDGKPIPYEQARSRFCQDAAHSWAAYVAGVFLVLMRERDIDFKEGARLLIDSNVPEGKGVSSSAALEVAVMSAVAAAFQVSLSPRETALLCQKVENLIVGAPCGVMDQMTSACGEANQLLALLCQPAELQKFRPIPNEVAVWGIDSGVRHSVGAGDYGSVRTGAFMGYRVVAELAGLDVEKTATASLVRIHDARWGGYLANIAPAEFARDYFPHLPQRMLGADFVKRFGGINDSVTQVSPERNYEIRAPTAHPVYEHARVKEFAEILEAPSSTEMLSSLGELMYQSHASYSACGLGSTGTDLLVQLVREAGPAQELFGAKITGGGCGGTVAVLGRRGADAAVEKIAESYAQQTGHRPLIFSGSSPGAAAFGHLKLLAGN